MKQFIRPSVLAGAVYIVLSAIALAILIPLGVDEPSNVQYRALAPSYWPQIISIFIGLLGAAILARDLLFKSSPDDDENVFNPETFEVFWRAALVVAGTFLLYYALEPLGFVLTTAIALIVLMLAAGERRIRILIPVALGVPLVLHFFFTKVASIPIPSGILEPIFLMV